MSAYLATILLATITGCAQAVNLTVSTSGGNASSPILYGIMFEDINNSGDGGIHGQLLRNNGFQGDNATLEAWSAVGDADISKDGNNPLSSQLPYSLNIAVAAGANGTVGASNEGYMGVPVNADTYSTSFWYKGSYTGSLNISLVGNSSSIVYASSAVSVSRSDSFVAYNTTLKATQSPDGNNLWQVTFETSSSENVTMNIGLPQLFPATYKGRDNGLRNDVASFVADLQPSFLRFPGGNNIEGNSTDNRWKWNLTIGPLEDRPGRQGDWGYANTDALGLDEYFDWCEDMNMAPVLALWSGLSLGGGTPVSGDALSPYVDEAMNELEYVLGDSNSKYGSLRAKYGREDPYPVKMVEIGNEDDLNGGCSTYGERFTAFHDAISKAYPDLQIITSTTNSTCLPDPLPANVWTDIHHYESPDDFVSSFDEFDNYPRTRGSGIFVGEYASTTNNDGNRTVLQFMQASCSEAVYMIGLERNSDLVKMASYAPLIEHYGMTEWTPNLFGFSSDPGSLTGSTSYYVQRMFSTNHGATVLPVQSDVGFGPVYWVASQSSDGTSYYVKMANYAADASNVTIKIPDAKGLNSTASLQLVSGDALASNSAQNVIITTQTTSVSGDGSSGYSISLPAWGVAAMVVQSS